MNAVDPITPPAIVETVNADNYLAVKNIISRQLARLDQLTSERKVHKEKLANILDNDTTLSETQGKLKAVQREVKARKAAVLNTPEAQATSLHIKEKNEEIKELQEALSTHLTNYAQMTGTHVFEDADGTEREFKVKASIKPKQLNLF